jgi:hypothetical protein
VVSKRLQTFAIARESLDTPQPQVEVEMNSAVETCRGVRKM